MVHLVEVGLPDVVDRIQQDLPFDVADVLADPFFQVRVGLDGQLRDLLHDRLPGGAHRDGVGQVVFHREVTSKVRLVDRPGGVFGQQVHLEHLGDLDVHGVFDAGEDLVADIFAVQDAAAQLVHHLALGIHHVVVFQQVLADLEVLGFHPLLGSGDGTVQKGMGDDLALLGSQAVHHRADVLTPEDPHEIVVQGKEESARARIALAPGTAAELVVHAAAFVSFGAHDVQSTQRSHGDLLLLPKVPRCGVGGIILFDADLVDGLEPFQRGAFQLGEGLFHQGLFRPERHDGLVLLGRVHGKSAGDETRLHPMGKQTFPCGVAQHDVRSATGHVGCDGHLAQAAGVKHDQRLPGMLLGVEDIVGDAVAG